jgi:hypothetical protein
LGSGKWSEGGEPWEVYHLRHDSIFETDLSAEEAEAWRTLPQSSRLAPRYRAKLKVARWEFGQTIINVVRCPACPQGAQVDSERKATKAALERLFVDDEDGLASAFEEYKL